MSEIWRFTGNPENWLTAVSISKWALNEHSRGLWERSIRPGDIALFHATAKSDFAAGGSSTVIGFGYVGQPLAKKTDFWWVQEVRDKENHWPYVIPLVETYLFSDITDIDFSVPVDKKTPDQVKKEIAILIADGVTIHNLNAQASALDPECPNFPVNGSASRVNACFGQLIVGRSQDLFVPHDTQLTTLLEEALSSTIDEQLSGLDKATLLAQAMAFDNTTAQSHHIVNGPRRVRQENQRQKRRVAALEDYTCQLCGFRYQYVRKNGKPGWIIQVDHIQEKSPQGMESLKNLWVLCPNCHGKKTCGVIAVDLKAKKVSE